MNIDVNIDTMAYKKKPVSVYIINTRISKNIENISLVLESGRIDHSESDRNSQFELNRNSQCTLAN